MNQTAQSDRRTSLPRRAILLIAVALPLGTTRVDAQQTCQGPSLPVDIFTVSKLDDGAGAVAPTLHVADPNSPAQVSGYNVYRSPSASTAPGAWGLPAFNAADEDAATPGVQWSDTSGEMPASGVHFYLVSAYNRDCDEEGPWRQPSVPDTDGDGLGDADDGCPGTPPGAVLLASGCSATDYMVQPGRLVAGIDRKLDEFVAGLPAGGAPQEIFDNVAEARLALGAVADDLRDALPCSAETNLTMAGAYLDGVVDTIQQLLASLSAAGAAGGGSGGGSGGTDGDYVYPSPEYRLWEGQLFKFMAAHDEAAQSSAIASQVCAAGGTALDLAGRVRRLDDSTRTLELDSGERIVLGWTVEIQDGDELAEDQPVQLQGERFDGIGLASTVVTQVSPFPYIDTTIYDDCLQLRVLPVQPLPGAPYPQPGWVRHSPEGYRTTDTFLNLEAGMKLLTESSCPGIVPGLGPGGEDVKIDYWYRLLLSYQPLQGNFVSMSPLAAKVSGNSFPILFPTMHPLGTHTLYSNKYKRTCIDSGLNLPIINPENGNVVGSRPVWQCSSEQLVTSYSDTVLMRDPQAYCDALYSETTFDIEDHDFNDWDPVSVSSLSLPVAGVQNVTFSALGDKIVGGMPTASTVTLNEPFAVYSPYGSIRWGYGTNRRSHLDWPHVTGTRNGEPYRYTCGVPRIVTDRIYNCTGPPDTLYRMPFPMNWDKLITQGNGGSFTHNGWQWYALDIDGNTGDPLRAMRGGEVVMIRTDMTLNCMTQTCTQWGMPPNGKLDEAGNYVALQHQDGTVGWYSHMVVGSSPLKLGDKVKRGSFLGQLGNTGNSSGPHVHVHVTPEDPVTWGTTTNYVSYEAYNVTDATFQTCFVPTQGKTYRSTNLP